jgi:hypothetical protein
MDEERIMIIIGQLMDKMTENQRLQTLAKENGLTYKPIMDLSDTAIDDIITSMVALVLAKSVNDKDYELLVRTGIQKRSLKASIINKYKDQAGEYLNKYKMSLVSTAV